MFTSTLEIHLKLNVYIFGEPRVVRGLEGAHPADGGASLKI